MGKGHGGLVFWLCRCTSNGRGEDNLVCWNRGELEHAFPARTRLATLSCAHNHRRTQGRRRTVRTQGVRCFGDERPGRRCGLYVGLSFTSRLDTITQGWVVALITTRLRSAPGYPAMAARCALLAPGRRAPPARRALVPNGHPCCPPPHQRPTTASPTRAARAIRIARTSPSHLVLAGRDAPAPMARSKQHTRIHNAHTPLIVKLSSNSILVFQRRTPHSRRWYGLMEWTGVLDREKNLVDAR